MGYIEQIITQLAYQVNTFNKEDCSSVEQLLNALSAVVMGHSKARDICRKPELQLKTVLELLELNSKNNDQYLVSSFIILCTIFNKFNKFKKMLYN